MTGVHCSRLQMGCSKTFWVSGQCWPSRCTSDPWRPLRAPAGAASPRRYRDHSPLAMLTSGLHLEVRVCSISVMVFAPQEAITLSAHSMVRRRSVKGVMGRPEGIAASSQDNKTFLTSQLVHFRLRKWYVTCSFKNTDIACRKKYFWTQHHLTPIEISGGLKAIYLSPNFTFLPSKCG
jgi:hypothetical protein